MPGRFISYTAGSSFVRDLEAVEKKKVRFDHQRTTGFLAGFEEIVAG